MNGMTESQQTMLRSYCSLYCRVEETRKNEAESLNIRHRILNVAPINSMPYIGPPLPHSYVPSSPRVEDPEAIVKVGPAMVYCPLTTSKKWDHIVSASKTGVSLTGTAAMGQVGPVIGRVDIGENENSYFFRVSLPGVARDQSECLLKLINFFSLRRHNVQRFVLFVIWEQD